MYAFYLDGEEGIATFSGSPFGGEMSMDGPFADDAYLDELALTAGASFPYLFDFGDSWHFTVTLEKIEAEAKKLAKPVILEKHGEAPKQYRNWEEEDW